MKPGIPAASPRNVLVVLAIALVLGAGWFGRDLVLGKPVSVLAVVEQDVVQSLTAPGSVSQPERLPLAPPVSGLVARVLVKPGDHVEAGAVLIELDAKEALAAVEQARTEAAQAEARLRARAPAAPAAPPVNTPQAQAQVEQARRQAERTRELRDKGFMSDAALNNALRALEAAETQLRAAAAQGRPAAGAEDAAARSALMQARSMMQAAQARADEALIRSPVAGTVLSVNVQRGGVVTAGRDMLVLAPEGDAEIAVQVDTERAKAVRVGQKALVLLTPAAEAGNAAAGQAAADKTADKAAEKSAEKAGDKAAEKAPAPAADKAAPAKDGKATPAAARAPGSDAAAQAKTGDAKNAGGNAATPAAPAAQAAPQRIQAEVAWIDEGSDPERKRTELRLAPAAGTPLPANAKLSVSIELARRPGALAVPLAAVREAASAKPWVLAVIDGRAQRRNVTLGLRGDTHAEVIEGLTAGMLLVPAGEDVGEDEKVRIVSGMGAAPATAVPAPAANAPAGNPGEGSATK